MSCLPSSKTGWLGTISERTHGHTRSIVRSSIPSRDQRLSIGRPAHMRPNNRFQLTSPPLRFSHVPILRRQSVKGSARKLDALLVVSITLLCTAAPLLPTNAAIAAASATAVLAVLAWYKRCRAAAPLSIFCVICLGLVLSGVRYFPLVLGLSLLSYAGVVRGVPWLRGTATWAQWGSFDATVRFLSVAAWLLAAAALFSWYLLLRPNVADIVETFVP